MPEVTIERVGVDRVDDCEPLYHALYTHHGEITPEWGPLRPFEDAWARRHKIYTDVREEGGVLWLALIDDEPVGPCIAEQEEGQSPTWQWPGSFLSVIDLIVRPELDTFRNSRRVQATVADLRAAR